MDAINTGPVDVVVLQFPGNKFHGRILPAVRDLVSRDIVRVLDLLFVWKDTDGSLGVAELKDLAQDLESDFGDLIEQIPGGWLDAEDAEEVAPNLEPDSSVALLADREPVGHPVRRGRPRRRRRGPGPGPRGRRVRRRPAPPRRRRPDMGLVRGTARTAVVAGTATAVSNRVPAVRPTAGTTSRPSSRRSTNSRRPQPTYQQPPPQQVTYLAPTDYYPAPQDAAPQPAGDDLTTQLQKIAGLHAQGILNDAEFAAAKAKILGA